jgi:uncharacterized protein DUF6817
MKRELQDFLLSLGTENTPHGGGSLLDHLKGVHDLLRDWDNSVDVCNGGLFHSIYGTKAFKHRSLPEHRRVELVDLIGPYAEELAHEFSTGERPLFRNVTGPEKRLHLQEIEAANLIEQHSGYRFLRQLLPMKLSNGARAAILLEVA